MSVAIFSSWTPRPVIVCTLLERQWLGIMTRSFMNLQVTVLYVHNDRGAREYQRERVLCCYLSLLVLNSLVRKYWLDYLAILNTHWYLSPRWMIVFLSDPSWNTDQGVQHVRKSLGCTKPKGEIKVKAISWWLRCDLNANSAQHRPVIIALQCGCERAYMLGPERWWTMPEQDEARGNSGGGP